MLKGRRLQSILPNTLRIFPIVAGSRGHLARGEFEVIYGVPFKELEALVAAELTEAYPNGVEIDWESFKKGCK